MPPGTAHIPQIIKGVSWDDFLQTSNGIVLDSSHTDLRSSRSQPRNEFPAWIPVVRVPFFGQSFVRGTHAAVSDTISLLHNFLHGRLRLPERVARDHQELLFGQRNIACLLKSSQATQLVVCGACKAPRPKSFFDKQNLFFR